MLLDPSPDAQGEVVLALEDGTPYLLTRPVDRGRVALLTGTLDRDWNDLPIRPDFVPLLEQVLTWCLFLPKYHRRHAAWAALTSPYYSMMGEATEQKRRAFAGGPARRASARAREPAQGWY